MKAPLIFTLLLSCYCHISLGQSSMILTSNFDTTKKETVVYGSYIHLELHPKKLGIDSANIDVRLYGIVKEVSDSSLTLYIESESIQIERKDGFTSYISNQYEHKKELRTFHVREIYELSHTSRRRLTLTSITGSIGVTSILAGLFVAPLASIDYRNGGFKTRQYLMMLGSGAAGGLVFMPITLHVARKSDFLIVYDESNPDHIIGWTISYRK